MSQADCHRSLVESADAWRAATNTLQDRRRGGLRRGRRARRRGPYHQLGHLMVSDLPSGPSADELHEALVAVRIAAWHYQDAVHSALPELAVVAESDRDVLAAVQAIPAGQARAGMSWRAEPRWAADGAAAASVFLERHADDPRRAELVGLALVEVPAAA